MIPLLLTLYLAFTLATALIHRRGRSEETGLRGGAARVETAYYLAERRASALHVGTSLLGTSIGGSSLFVSTALVATYGPAGLVLEIASGIGLVLLGLLYARKIRLSGAFSLAGILEQTFSPALKRPIALVMSAAEVLWFLLLIKAMAEILPPALLYPTCAAVILYAGLGGQGAVIRTDLIQSIILMAGIAFIALTRTTHTPLTLSCHLFPALPSIAILGFASHLTGSDIVSRLLTASDANAARRGCFIAAGGKALWALLLLAAFAGLPSGSTTPVTALLNGAPYYLSIILLLTILSALLSSMDTVLISAATFLLHDFLHIRHTSERVITLTLLIGTFALLISIFTAPLITYFKLSYALFVGGLSPLVVVALSMGKRPAYPLVALPGIILGGITAVCGWLWVGIFISALFALASYLPERRLSHESIPVR